MSIYNITLVGIKKTTWTSSCWSASLTNKIIGNQNQEISQNSHKYQYDREYSWDNRNIFAELHEAFQLQKNHSKKYPGSNSDTCKVDEWPNLYWRHSFTLIIDRFILAQPFHEKACIYCKNRVQCLCKYSFMATIQQGKTTFTILDELQTKHPDLIKLILATESMDDSERQYWFDILPSCLLYTSDAADE